MQSSFMFDAVTQLTSKQLRRNEDRDYCSPVLPVLHDDLLKHACRHLTFHFMSTKSCCPILCDKQL